MASGNPFDAGVRGHPPGAVIRSVTLTPYQLPLCQPWRTARGQVTRRSGWLVSLSDGDGGVGYGDCAPWPAMGTESPRLALDTLRQAACELPGKALSGAFSGLDRLVGVPSARCGIEVALLDLAAKRAGCPLALWLNPNAAMRVNVNAACGGAVGDDLPGRVRAGVEAGFTVLKLKVGIASRTAELKTLHELSAELPPGRTLRLDANGAWAGGQALQFVKGLAGCAVESLEEPLAEGDPAALRRLQEQVDWPIALDESLQGGRRVIGPRDLPVRRVIVKPMVFGGLLPALRFARRVRGFGIETVVTTTVDSAVGVRAACHLAAALNNGLAHGLATGQWLRQDLAPGVSVFGGIVALGDDPGLGFAADVSVVRE